jgi:hypothetical protein
MEFVLTASAITVFICGWLFSASSFALSKNWVPGRRSHGQSQYKLGYWGTCVCNIKDIQNKI